MDESLYDEFGNYLGPDLEDDEDDLEYEQEQEQDEADFDANYDQQQQQEDEDEVMEEQNALMRVDGK
jgi:U5 small nuclear ribonucleoprotein component